MFNNLKYFNKYIFDIKFFIILFLFWLSINTGSKYLDFQFLKDNFFSNKLNFARSILPYLILIYLLIYGYFYERKNFFSLDLVFKLFIVYGFLQISGLIYYKQNLYEHYWVICLLSLILFYNLIIQKKNKNLIYSIFCVNMFFVITIFIIFISITFKENIFSTNLLYYSKAFYLSFQNEALPRSSGLARMGLIIFLFFNALYFSNDYSKKLNNLLIFSNIIIIATILLLQSRGAILSLIIMLILINFFYKFKNFKSRLKYLFYFLLIPIFIFIIYPNAKIYLIEKFGTINDLKSNPKKEIKLKNLEIGLRDEIILQTDTAKSFKSKIYSYSNNRLNAWEYLLQIFFKNQINEEMKNKLSSYKLSNFLSKDKKNILSGHGPQADRHFLRNKPINGADTVLGPFGAHASNGYIYSLICSGILGLIIFSMINMIIFFKIFKIITSKQTNTINDEPLLSSAIFIIIFLQFRLLIENSFSVYGVDLLILISAYSIINNKYKEINI